MNKTVKYVGHRGTKCLNGVENTYEAFQEAILLNYDAIETDVRITLDGVYICFHDETLTRLTLNSKETFHNSVNEMHYKDLKQVKLTQIDKDGKIRCGKICLFDDYLTLCQTNNKIPVIELKWTNGMYADNDNPTNHNYSNIDGLINKIYDHHLENEAIIMTSMIGCLDYIKSKYPTMKLQWLCYKRTHEFKTYCINQGFDLDVEYTYCDQSLVEYCHQNNRIINIWTLNDETLLDHYINLNVDMITTDLIKPKR